MNHVTSRDGTRIAYSKLGSGPPLLLVDGAMCTRTFGPMPKLAPLLAKHFTVVHYDRRGRGDSTNEGAYAVEREIEDMRALVDMMGGSAFLYGTSSGAVLAARAVAGGVKALGLVLHEPPLCLDGTRTPDPIDYREQIGVMLTNNKKSDAVALFMRVVGVPAIAVRIMRFVPSVWRPIVAVAHTLPNDFAILGDTQRGGVMPGELADALSRIDAPTVVVAGGKSPPYLHHAVQTVARLIRGATHCVAPKQDHNIAAAAIAPIILAHFQALAARGKTAA